MQVKIWMTRQVMTVSPRDSLLAAKVLLEQRTVRQLPVVQRGQLVGILTDRDVRDALPSIFQASPRGPRATQRQLQQIHVEDVMTLGPLSVDPEASLREAAATLLRHRIGGLPVVRHRELLGILTRGDVLRAWTHYASRLEAQEQGEPELLPHEGLLEPLLPQAQGAG